MTENEAAAAIKACMAPIAVCKIGFTEQQYDEFFFILSVSDSLFLGVSERDFRLDGYTVKRLSDVSSVEAIRGTYLKIHQQEGNTSRINRSPVNVSSWHSVFKSVVASGEIVIVEGLAPESHSKYFFVGRVLAAGEQGLRFRSFDGAGNWSERALTIPYNTVTSLTFGSSYVTTYSKYVRPYPETTTQRPNVNR